MRALTSKLAGARRAYSSISNKLSPVAGLPASAVDYHQTAKDFASQEFAPHAGRWDEEHFFPEDALRKAAALGFGGLYVSPDHGGSGLSREESIPIIEALAGADTSTTAYLTIHNMVAWMVDAFGDAELKGRFLPKLTTMEHFASYCLTEPGEGATCGRADAGRFAARCPLAPPGSVPTSTVDLCVCCADDDMALQGAAATRRACPRAPCGTATRTC